MRRGVQMQRIVIVGPPGSGKSTLGKTLSDKLDIPVTHLDSLFFKAGWVEIEKKELVEKVTHLISTNEKWIIEGNYSSTFPIRLQHCDQVIFLDYPRSLYLFRAIKRSFKYYGRTRPDMAEGCFERFDFSFFKYVWNFPKRRKNLLAILNEHSKDKNNIVILKNTKELNHYLDTIN